MDIETRKLLTSSLSKVVGEIAASLRPQLLAAGPVRQRAEWLHKNEQVGDARDAWSPLGEPDALPLTAHHRVHQDSGSSQGQSAVSRRSEDGREYPSRAKFRRGGRPLGLPWVGRIGIDTSLCRLAAPPEWLALLALHHDSLARHRLSANGAHA